MLFFWFGDSLGYFFQTLGNFFQSSGHPGPNDGTSPLSVGSVISTGENLKFIWAEFAIFSKSVLSQTKARQLHGMHTATYRAENSAQVLSFSSSLSVRGAR